MANPSFEAMSAARLLSNNIQIFAGTLVAHTLKPFNARSMTSNHLESVNKYLSASRYYPVPEDPSEHVVGEIQNVHAGIQPDADTGKRTPFITLNSDGLLLQYTVKPDSIIGPTVQKRVYLIADHGKKSVSGDSFILSTDDVEAFRAMLPELEAASIDEVQALNNAFAEID
jgi:hypothetical protein